MAAPGAADRDRDLGDVLRDEAEAPSLRWECKEPGGTDRTAGVVLGDNTVVSQAAPAGDVAAEQPKYHPLDGYWTSNQDLLGVLLIESS